MRGRNVHSTRIYVNAVHKLYRVSKPLNSISRKKIIDTLSEAGTPQSLVELSKSFQIKGKEASKQLLSQLDFLIKNGSIIRNRRNRYALSEKMDMISGHVIGHRDGYGFIDIVGEESGIYLAPKEMRRVLHGDKVLVRVKRIDSRGRREGTIVSLIETTLTHIVGRFHQDRGMAYVLPDDSRMNLDVLIHPEDQAGALDGQIVSVKLDSHPFESRKIHGIVVEVLGDEMAPGMESEIAIRKHSIPYEWPAEVIAQAREIESKSAETGDLKHRKDCRNMALVTIDGADARDFDDAVFAEPNNHGWRLVVAIADVSHYVKPDSALDSNALVRGNSVYFPNRVIPMLPEHLSNGLCSLNPHVDRMVLVCDMQLNGDGALSDYRFYEAIIRSHARLTYEMAQGIFTGEDSDHKLQPNVLASLHSLKSVYEKLRQVRTKNGSIDLEIAEPSFEFDEDRKIEAVKSRQRLMSHRVIEECMLLANVCAARLLEDSLPSAMYRNHDKPSEEKIVDLARVYSGFGIKLTGACQDSKSLMRAVEQARTQRPDVAQTLQILLLRTMKQAIYSSVCTPHFALGFEQYTHFTSPIRRYPDLIVHRLIKHCAAMPGHYYDAAQLTSMAEHCCLTERRADDATRDVYQWLKVEFMKDRIGEQFEGTVSGVTPFGVFVTLNDMYIDGLVHISELGKDYFHFDPLRYTLSGERSGRSYKLGDAFTVIVVGINLDDAKVDFKPVSDPTPDPKLKRKSGKWSKVKL